jgi:hypothetical protein
VSAALISPRPGVFVENVKYLIAAATPVEVVLLALSFAGNNVENDLEIMPSKNSSQSNLFQKFPKHFDFISWFICSIR